MLRPGKLPSQGTYDSDTGTRLVTAHSNRWRLGHVVPPLVIVLIYSVNRLFFTLLLPIIRERLGPFWGRVHQFFGLLLTFQVASNYTAAAFTDPGRIALAYAAPGITLDDPTLPSVDDLECKAFV